jgi:alkylation response protein AidB-like acyl-CoA dehydrogenase
MELAEFRSSLDRWLDEVFDLAADGLGDDVTIGDGAESERWRAEYLYSRAASIYGGSGEIQRNIIARQLLDLGVDR